MSAVSSLIGGHTFRDICAALLGENINHDVDSPLLQQLAYYGVLYNHIRNFIDTHHPGHALLSSPREKSFSQPQTSPSVYVEALCDGLSHLLDEYVTRVLKLTAPGDAFKDHGQFMHNLNCELSVLKGLHALVDEIATLQPKSADLFEIVLKHCNTGFSNVRQSISRVLLYSVHNCLVSQITSWCLFSRLDKDPYGEFFIRRVDSGRKHPFAAFSHRDAPMMYEEWNSLYDVEDSACVRYISAVVCKEILFIGKAMEVMSKESKLEGHDIGLISELRSVLERLVVANDFNRIDGDPGHVEMEDHFNDFELVVNKSHELVSSRMWDFVESSDATHGNLMSILQSFRNFFLMGQGELFSGMFEIIMKDLERIRSPALFKKSIREAFETVKQDSFPSQSFAHRFSLLLKPVDANGMESDNSDVLLLGNVFVSETMRYDQGVRGYEFTRQCSNMNRAGVTGSLWKINPVRMTQHFSVRFSLTIHQMFQLEKDNSSFSFIVQNHTLDISSLDLIKDTHHWALAFEHNTGFAIHVQKCAAPWSTEGAESDDENEENWCKVTVAMLGSDLEQIDPSHTVTFRMNDDEGLTFLTEYDHLKRAVLVHALGSRSDELLAEITADVSLFTKGAAYAWLGFVAVSPKLSQSFELQDWKIKEECFDVYVGGSTQDLMHTIWKQIYLQFEFLHISESLFFGAQDIAVYNCVFQQLFLVNFAHFQLREAWLRFKSREFIATTENYRLFLMVRYKMFFFVDHLMSYLQVEVLEKEFGHLWDQVCQKKSFGVARQLHQEFLSEISWKCFSHWSVSVF